MIELKVDSDLVTWTESFLTGQKVQLVIDGHNNKEKNVEIGIFQDFLVSLIFFPIYINRVFNKIFEINF